MVIVLILESFVFLVVFCVCVEGFVWDSVSLYSSASPGTHSVDQTCLNSQRSDCFSLSSAGLKVCATMPGGTSCFNNYGFLFLSTVSLLCSFLSSTQTFASHIFLRFNLLNIIFRMLISWKVFLFLSIMVDQSRLAIIHNLDTQSPKLIKHFWHYDMATCLRGSGSRMWCFDWEWPPSGSCVWKLRP